MSEFFSSFPWIFAIKLLLLIVGFLLVVFKEADKPKIAFIFAGAIAILNVFNEGIKFSNHKDASVEEQKYKTFVKETSEVPALTGSAVPDRMSH